LLEPYAGENETPKIDIIEPTLMILPPGRLHGLEGGPGAEERAGEVRVEDLVPLGERVVLGLLADVGPRVVHEDVETAAPIHRGPDQGVDRRFVGDIDGDRERLTAELFQLADGGGGLRLVTRRHDDASARARQAAGHAEADPAVTAGDDRDFSLEIEH